MRSPVIFFIGFIFLFISCNNEKATSNLEQAFIKSLKDGQFKTLEPFFPTRELYRSVAKKDSLMSDAKVDSILAKVNQRLKDEWDKIAATVKNKKIELGKVVVKETILVSFDPRDKNTSQTMVVVYDYNGKTWDDLGLMVKQIDKKTYLLQIPMPTKVFSFADSTLANSSDARLTQELQQPGFEQSVKDQVKRMINWSKEDNIKEFSAFVVYKGDDQSRSWKSAVNMADSNESKMATRRLKEVKTAMTDCNDYSFGEMNSERESEGLWIIQPVICGNKIIHFAFLKIKDKLLFGNVDTDDAVR